MGPEPSLLSYLSLSEATMVGSAHGGGGPGRGTGDAGRAGSGEPGWTVAARRPTVTSKGIVLVVDDDADIVESTRDFLEFEGYAVEIASNGRDALGVLERMPAAPKLLLIDLIMPIMGGSQLLIELAKRPEFAKIPVIPEVVIFFGGKILRGNRTIKRDTTGYDVVIVAASTEAVAARPGDLPGG